ncbi:phytoene/squalene synthase family protein [Natrialba chahannaoensis]|uniref:phytoene/squalene synthase family protein n=1 Tax=Natrialba chahannaoensis TaxID=68911 RepID=UPI000677B98F|nr:phytoene/squalene synthase family protein [Natrialba chahannaoensis]
MHQGHIDSDKAKAIQKRTGKTFYLATRFLPARVRHATHVLYGFFRIADEVVDDAAGMPPAEQRAELESLRAQALGEANADDPVLTAFADLKEAAAIADEEVNVFIDAMASDITTSRYETYAELESYMRGSAAAVGVMMTAVMDMESELEDAALPHAIALGEAFQLTNFLRDVREDIVERDRIYLPQRTLEKHGVSEAQIQRLEHSHSFESVMRDELQRAEERYRAGVTGIQYLPDDCQLPVLLAAVLYAEHHAIIRGQEYDVLTSAPSLSTVRKLRCLVKTRWHWHWNRDPEAVFRRVSAVPVADSETESRGSGHGGGVPTQ